jgi:phosphonate transport system substrate-binding protein
MNLNRISLRLTCAALTLLSFRPALAGDLVMGLIPAENNEDMIKHFEPMRAYLEKKVGQHIKVFTATDYTGVIEAMRKKRVDVAFFGPLSYCLAEQEAGAEAFAVGVLKNGKSTYRSIFIVPGDSPIKSLKDLKGKSVAFVDPVSTSGCLMPTFMVKRETGQMPEQFFGKFTFAGSHDAAELAVKNRTVDAAADNDITYAAMLAKGLITEQSNRVLAESPDLPGSPLAYRKDLPADLKTRIREAIITAHKEINVSGYGNLIRYDATGPADYQMVRDLAKTLGLTKEQMLK